jgi:hypothetical protein
VSDFRRLRSYDRFLIPVHALVWTASIILDAADHIRNSQLKLLRATRAVHIQAAACVAAPSPTSGDVTSAATATVSDKSTFHPLHRGDVAALPTVT